MEDFNLKEFEPYIIIFIGLSVLLFSLLKKSNSSRLKDTGEKVEGIVYELGTSSGYSFDNDSPNNGVNNKVTIRFVTKKGEWITCEMKQFAFFFTGQYKEGEKVDVFYDRDDPSKFFVDTKQSDSFARILLGVLGFIVSCFGLYLLLV